VGHEFVGGRQQAEDGEVSGNNWCGEDDVVMRTRGKVGLFVARRLGERVLRRGLLLVVG